VLPTLYAWIEGWRKAKEDHEQGAT